MKRFLRVCLSLALSTPFAASANTPPDDKQAAEVKTRTRAFWQQVTSGKFEEARKSLFVAEDAPSLADAEIHARMVKDEFEEATKFLKDFGEQAKARDIKVTEVQKQDSGTVARVVMSVWSPEEKEFEELSLTWIKTATSGWKIIDL